MICLLKPDFEKCINAATNLLYKQDLSTRILDVEKLQYDKPIIFDSIQKYCLHTNEPIERFISDNNETLKDGCTIYDKKTGYYIILYNDEVTYFQHRNWTLGHEVGHVYLGHTTDGDLEEIEAHFFASQLFMPEYSLYMTAKEYGRITKDDIAEIFGVSPESATKRIHTMNKKYSVSATIRDKEIWKAQKKRVDMYFMHKNDGGDHKNALTVWNAFKTEYDPVQRTEMYAQMLPY